MISMKKFSLGDVMNQRNDEDAVQTQRGTTDRKKGANGKLQKYGVSFNI